MRRLSMITAPVLLVYFFFMPCYAAQESLDGHWEGALVRNGAETRVAVELKTRAGTLEGTIDISEQIIVGAPLSNLKLDSSKLHFEQPEFDAIFDGELQGDKITGKMKVYGALDGTFYLKRAEAKPLPYGQEEARFRNGDVTLAGTVIIPKTKGPHPAVVFTHTSAPSTRNAARYLADHLARYGIASLIYDKRGVGASAPDVDWRRVSLYDKAGDALAGIQLLKGHKDINPKRIGLYGHSQGGWIVVIAAARSKDVAFIIASSGAFVPPWQQETYRVEHRMRADGFPEDEIREAVAFMRLKFEVGRTGQGWEKLDATMQELRSKNKKWFSGYTGAPKSLEASRWFWVNEFSYNPAPDLEKIKIPVLALFAEKETFVPVEESITALEKAMKKAGNKDYTIRIFPKVDHGMFVYAEKGSPWHWPLLVDGYLDTITEWVLKRVDVPKSRSLTIR